MSQLVRVDDRSGALHLALGDVQRHHADQGAGAVEHQGARLTVDLDPAQCGARDPPVLAAR
jgi:hypothetical protein